ncbi:MAG TPA: DUF2892 domain-containing protein [Polyangiaceae bacterium]|nr:DUF2892 domain-containing protein [Polyangiaceae bacterium]
MSFNVAPIDQAIRIGLGLFVVATPVLDLHTYPYSLLGLVLMGTGLVGFCPIYAALRALVPQGITPQHSKG